MAKHKSAAARSTATAAPEQAEAPEVDPRALGKELAEVMAELAVASDPKRILDLNTRLARVQSKIQGVQREADVRRQEAISSYVKSVEEALTAAGLPEPPAGLDTLTIQVQRAESGEVEGLKVLAGGGRPRSASRAASPQYHTKKAPGGMSQGQWYYERLAAGERKTEIAQDVGCAASSVHASAKSWAERQGLPVL